MISVLVPDCVTNRPEAAEVRPTYTETTSFPPVWSASGFAGNVAAGFALSPADWESIDGSYDHLDTFDVIVDLQRTALSASVRAPSDARTLQDLPPGVFLVDGEQLTTDEYFAGVKAEFPCPAPRPSR